MFQPIVLADVIELRAIAYKPAQLNQFRQARPVFYIAFAAGEPLVLKGEVRLTGDRLDLGGTEETVFWGGKMLKGISGIKLQVCSVKEVLEMNKPEFAEKAPEPLHGDYFVECMAQALVWYKLPFLEALGSLKIIEETNIALNRGNDAEISQRQAELAETIKQIKKREDFFEVLGQVCAMDLFIGNTDRFRPTGTLVNVGNIMWTIKNKKTLTPLALDFLDIGNSNGGANLSKTLANVPNWAGLTLNDPNRISLYATEVIKSLNAEIQSAMNNADVKFTYFKPKHGMRIIKGINSGTETLRKLLQTRARDKALSAGVRDRMITLGWIPGEAAKPFMRGAAVVGPRPPSDFGSRSRNIV